MKILVVHNRYLFVGGEDCVVESEIELLKSKGHEVIEYYRSNEEVVLASRWKKFQMLIDGLTRSKQTYQEISDLIQKHQPDVAHFHNPFFMMTPSAYDACCDANVPIVQSLHNYRFLCAKGMFFNEGKICERCLERGGSQAVLTRCIEGYFLKSLFFAGALMAYRRRKIMKKKVGVFIAPSQFCKEMHCRYARIDSDRIIVKPHFIEDPGVVEGRGDYALYVAAVREYKGVSTLLETWKSIPDFCLKLVGSIPPEGKHFKDNITQKSVEFMGERRFKETQELIANSAFVVVPSLCYETFGRVIIEAYAYGKPVIVSDIGALRERVVDGKTGMLFKAGDAEDLRMKVRQYIDNPQLVEQMGKNARHIYEKLYRPDNNYEQLMGVYGKVLS